MIKIHATKKLLTKLPVNKAGYLPDDKSNVSSPPHVSENPLSGWHANLITLQRRNCILMVHDQTRFPLFMPCLTKPDFSNLNWHFQDYFMNTLLKLDANQQQMDAAILLLSVLCVDSVCNRSVQGTMNYMKRSIDHMLWYDDADITDLSGYRTGAWLAKAPCTVKGQKDCIWPIEAMLSLLDNSSVSKGVPSNVVLLKDYKR